MRLLRRVPIAIVTVIALAFSAMLPVSASAAQLTYTLSGTISLDGVGPGVTIGQTLIYIVDAESDETISGDLTGVLSWHFQLPAGNYYVITTNTNGFEYDLQTISVSGDRTVDVVLHHTQQVAVTGTVLNYRETADQMYVDAYRIIPGTDGVFVPFGYTKVHNIVQYQPPFVDVPDGSYSLALPRGNYWLVASDGSDYDDTTSTLEPRYVTGEDLDSLTAQPYSVTGNQKAPSVVLPRRDGHPSHMEPGAFNMQFVVSTGPLVQVAPWYPSNATITYQWLRNGVPIAGANSLVYSTVKADDHKSLTLRLTGVATGFSTTIASSPVVDARFVPRTFGVDLTMKGSVDVGKTVRFKVIHKPKGAKVVYRLYWGKKLISTKKTGTVKIKRYMRTKQLKMKATVSLVGYKTVNLIWYF